MHSYILHLGINNIYSESRLHRHGCVSSKNVDIGGLSI